MFSETSQAHHQRLIVAGVVAAHSCHCLVHPDAAAEITSGKAPGYPMPAVPSFPADATMITPAAIALSIAACSRASGEDPPRLILMTIGEPWRGPRLRSAT